MESCLHQREVAYRLADACLQVFDELAESDRALRSSQMQVELRLQQTGAFFLCDEQLSVILDRIAEVGADVRRFCEYLGVDGVAKIPAHEVEYALAALEAKRRRPA